MLQQVGPPKRPNFLGPSVRFSASDDRNDLTTAIIDGARRLCRDRVGTNVSGHATRLREHATGTECPEAFLNLDHAAGVRFQRFSGPIEIRCLVSSSRTAPERHPRSSAYRLTRRRDRPHPSIEAPAETPMDNDQLWPRTSPESGVSRAGASVLNAVQPGLRRCTSWRCRREPARRTERQVDLRVAGLAGSFRRHSG